MFYQVDEFFWVFGMDSVRVVVYVDNTFTNIMASRKVVRVDEMKQSP